MTDRHTGSRRLGRPCSVCTSPHREEIDQALAAGAGSIRNIAGRHEIPATCVWRHAQGHLPATMLAASANAQEARADRLLDAVLDLKARVEAAMHRAEVSGDDAGLIRAVAEARRVLELLARLAGQLTPDVAVTVNITATPEWTALMVAMMDALRQFPDARSALAESLGADRR